MDLNRSESKYSRAQYRVSKLKQFYDRILKGIIAILLTGAINYYLNEWEHPWFLWVVFGVILSISIKASRLFGASLLLGKDWEERKVRELMDKDVF